MGDMEHHLQFLKTVLSHRNQNMKVVKNKIDKFFKNRRAKKRINELKMFTNERRVMSVKFDAVSKSHLFSRSCILASYKASGVPKPSLVYSSLPKIMDRISTKRSVLRKVKERINLSKQLEN